jgi:hypothetical protein
MNIDLCSVTQGNTRTWSYFSQALGLMADLDLGVLLRLGWQLLFTRQN